MSFVFTTLVIFEIVLLFVVDGFELIVQPCDEHGELYCHRKKNVHTSLFIMTVYIIQGVLIGAE
jgi:hypothetical protein